MLVVAGALQIRCVYYLVLQMQNQKSQMVMLVKEEGGGSGGQSAENEALFLGSFPSIPLQFGLIGFSLLLVFL